MPLALDHLVFAGPDLAATVDLVTELTGVVPAPGGRHLGRGTANYLADLGTGAYLEIIGPDPAQPDPRHPRPFDIDSLTEPALVSWALRTTDLDATIATARANGYDPGDPREMSRDTTDGERLRWRLTTPDDLTPFLIDWGETPHPTTRGLPSLPLLNLSATHPDPQALAAVTNALEFDLPIHRADRPSLTATLRRPDAREVVLT